MRVMRLLIDTNIILDAILNREPWAKLAREVMLAIAEEKAVGCLTASSMTDIFYILRKHTVSKESAKQALLGLMAVFTVLDVTGGDCEKAFDLAMSDYEDALLAFCGKRHRVDYIITGDIKHFAGSPVKAVMPKEILGSL